MKNPGHERQAHSLDVVYDADEKKITAHGLHEFPEQALEYADEAEVLDMSSGTMTELPESVSRFKNLRVAFFSHHDFTRIPEVLGQCENLEFIGMRGCKIAEIHDESLAPSLQGVTLTDNLITEIPKSIGKLKQLRKFMVAGNHLQDVAEELMGCENLELLRLPVNHLRKDPTFLLQLPHLAWYSDAGNLFSHRHREKDEKKPSIDWSDIEIKEQIGESANNSVFRAITASGEDVAVKLYGSDLSTDGLPEDEMNASVVAGTHDNLIGAYGTIDNAPGGQQGMVMPLIPSRFEKLAHPPNLQTLTRDVYQNPELLPQTFIAQCLKDVATGLAHLHQQGVMHGDVYAHNILTDSKSGKSFLGDFGAASTYERGANNRSREQVDVRAFGYLVSELMAYDNPKSSISISYVKLKYIEEACLRDVPTARPTFKDVTSLLEEII